MMVRANWDCREYEVNACPGLLHLGEQGEIVIAGKACGLEIISDHEDRHVPVSWDDYRAGNARLYVSAMASFLPRKTKAGGKKHGFEGTPMFRGKFGHRKD